MKKEKEKGTNRETDREDGIWFEQNFGELKENELKFEG